ncbi:MULTISPECIES: hypothetical protein [unclassified Bradyrhizobium]|uniref:hypothetical protein n=1 Tax=unclassified Bradyrhizobium TaxID=2631580 RepID=UPI0028E39235|nr:MULTISPECIES: hypothetical protein [unclassified Bradyrhizobium]
MSIVPIMAAILKEELREHGILKLTHLDCELMIHSMIERIAELEETSSAGNVNNSHETERKGPSL